MSPVMKRKVKGTSEESELNAPQWSVVTSAECAANNLSYDEAVKLVRQMSNSISGLCIVTDKAAKRLYPKPPAKSNREPLHFILPNTFVETL